MTYNEKTESGRKERRKFENEYKRKFSFNFTVRKSPNWLLS